MSARGRGERVRGTARQRAVACGALAHARPSANPNQGVQAWRVGRASGRTWQCLPRSAALHQEERQRTCSAPAWPRSPGVARRAPRGRGRCHRARARSRVAEDCTRTSRGRARAKMVLSRGERPVSRISEKKGKSATCELSTLQRAVWSRAACVCGQSMLGTHVVASPGSYGALEVGGLTVHSFRNV